MDHEIDDEEILDLFRRDVVRVRFRGGRIAVVKLHARRGRYYPLTPTQHPKDGRYRYKIHLGKRQRTISRNVLVWMWVHRRVKADGMDIDHKDRNRFNDDPDNLRELDVSLNRSGYVVSDEPIPW